MIHRCRLGAGFLALGFAAAAEAVARLQTDGPWFVDQDGRVVLLHGFNLVDKGAAANACPDDLADGDGFTSSVARRMRRSSRSLPSWRINIS